MKNCKTFEHPLNDGHYLVAEIVEQRESPGCITPGVHIYVFPSADDSIDLDMAMVPSRSQLQSVWAQLTDWIMANADGLTTG